MIQLAPNQNIPEHLHTKKKFQFICDCGNIFWTLWASFKTGQAKTCGKCKIFKWKQSGRIRFGKLELIDPINDIKRLTDKHHWKCDCGNQKLIQVINVLNGDTNSCGCICKQSIRGLQPYHPVKSKIIWLQELSELIDRGLPDNWSTGANLKASFRCACGNEYIRKFSKYDSVKSTCGRCNEISIIRGHQINQFTYDDESGIINTKSTVQKYFICKCGKRTLLNIRDIFSGNKKICSKCNEITAQEIANKRFGKLIIKYPENIKRYSGKKIWWNCECGGEIYTGIYSVLSGKTKTCGKCRQPIQNWYIQNREEIRALKCPIPAGIILNGIQALEIINTVSDPFKALCPVCDNIYFPRLHGIKDGESITCGCTSNLLISTAQKEIAEFIQNLGINVILEYPINGLRYDIWVAASKLVIEYNGLLWHSNIDARRRELIKWQNAINEGMHCLTVYEDEWKYKRKCIENIIKNKLQIVSPKRTILRPKSCEIQQLESKIVNKLYETYHYIGGTASKVNYGIFYQEQLIACISFKRPTRQSKYDWELARMVAHPDFRVHGIWSKLLRKFIKEYSPKSIVSFSDNRLFFGGVYEKLGFQYDGDVNSDYYWTKGKRRYHKSSLRKKPGEIGTEFELRTAQGYRQIWDLGKKRWVLHVK
jgi:GNAT superfamily N-acetyltransferase